MSRSKPRLLKHPVHSDPSLAVIRRPVVQREAHHGEGVGDHGTIQAIQAGEQFASPGSLLRVLLALHSPVAFRPGITRDEVAILRAATSASLRS